MRSTLLAASIVACLLGVSSGAAHAACDAGTRTSLDVQTVPFMYRIDKGKRAEEITRMGSFHRAGNASSVEVTQGLFVAQTSAWSSYKMRIAPQKDGSWCAGVVQLVVGYGSRQSGTIYVARQFPEGSCAYAAVLQHELKHYYRHKWILSETGRWLSGQFSGWSPTAPGATQAEAQAALEAMVARQIDPAFAYVQQFHGVASATVDTPQEYARVHALCNEWYDADIDISVLR